MHLNIIYSKTIYSLLVTGICMVLAAFTARANDHKTLLLKESSLNETTIDLVPFVYVQNKNGQAIAFTDVSNVLPINREIIFSLCIKNTTSDTLPLILRWGERYVMAKNIIIKSDVYSKSKFYEGPENITPLLFQPQETLTITFTLKELNRINPKLLSLFLISPEMNEKETHQMHVIQSFFLGLLAFLCVFNLLIYFVTGWKVYIKYVLYIFFGLIYFLFYFGFLQQIFPSAKHLSINLVYTWYSLIFISYFIFLNEFGNYKEYVPRAYTLLNIGIIFKSSQVVFDTLCHYAGFDFIYSPIYYNTIIILEIILMGFILFYIIRNTSIRGRLVILASILLIVGAILEQLNMIETIEHVYFIECGIAAELLIFSVGLGYITKEYYQEKRKAQHLYIQQLQENEKIQRDINDRLEEKVKQRTLELEEEKKRVENKNQENELLLSEIHHRVKNNLQIISSLLSLQERNVDNKDAKNAIIAGKDRIKSIELLHKMLYNKQTFQAVEMKEYIKNLVSELQKSYDIPDHKFLCELNFRTIYLETDTAIPIGLILNELVVNSIKYVQKKDEKLAITIVLEEKESLLHLNYYDNGIVQRTTQNNHGFGIRIIKALAQQIQGEIETQESPGLKYFFKIKKYKTINAHE